MEHFYGSIAFLSILLHWLGIKCAKSVFTVFRSRYFAVITVRKIGISYLILIKRPSCLCTIRKHLNLYREEYVRRCYISQPSINMINRHRPSSRLLVIAVGTELLPTPVASLWWGRGDSLCHLTFDPHWQQPNPEAPPQGNEELAVSLNG